ncbi:molybdopterin-binding protein [Vermiculatibacterium agrestimuris]|uniref:molybdopterin-binding protein n=1 Tax=Vermiculatibacterium agrestimuris TaxID=2941519 RepID=UPI002040F55D|nr:molybdopterin-binding protein [Vermiculatibacterium agrestimuris]
MKKVDVEQAVGLSLCHDITAMRDGFKGAAFRRGHVITPEDVPALLDLGKRTVFVWEENAGELHEEDCALRFAAMAPVEGAHYEGPSEGKVVLRADVRGMFRVDTALLREVNAIPDVTISTLPDHYPVEVGERLCSMRIVPLVTREENVLRAEELCRERPLLALKPYRRLKVGIIITGSELYSGRIKDKFEAVARRKLEKYPHELLGATICDDEPDMLLSAGRRFLEAGAELLIFSGGMSVDPDDLTPAAIRAMGAEVVSHGVPSQPGNMTLVAYLGQTAVLGVPGAAISMPTTIFDVLLPQVFTGQRLTLDDLRRLGEGGLCQQCGSCHFPNCTFGRY